MNLRANKPLRDHGIYTLLNRTFILVKRSENLSFLFSPERWQFHGPVDYRVSHGSIYDHGKRTTWTDGDLLDTGGTATAPSLSSLLKGAVKKRKAIRSAHHL